MSRSAKDPRAGFLAIAEQGRRQSLELTIGIEIRKVIRNAPGAHWDTYAAYDRIIRQLRAQGFEMRHYLRSTATAEEFIARALSFINLPVLSDTDWSCELPIFPVAANVPQALPASLLRTSPTQTAATQSPVAPVALLAAPAQPLLLAAWSEGTPAYIRYGAIPYTDTPKSRWEAGRVAAVRAIA